MRDNYTESFDAVIQHEGGYSDHPDDNGGATNLGITIGVLSAWLGRPATKAEVRALKLADVAPIYKKKYWDIIKADEIPSGLDYALFDYAVNSGPSRAVKAVQRLVGVTADGRVGPQTLAALNNYPNIPDLVGKLCDQRMTFLRGLSDWRVFGRGWERRVNEVLAMALTMARSNNSQTPPVRTVPVPLPEIGGVIVGAGTAAAGTDPEVQAGGGEALFYVGLALVVVSIAVFVIRYVKRRT